MSNLIRQLDLSGAVSDLPRVADFVASACGAACVEATACFDVQLAVEEACSNVLEHAYSGAGGTFSICLEAGGGDLAVTIRDRGRPFDPQGVPAPDLALPLRERPIGGLGLFLMRKLMDEVCFCTAPDGGNILWMLKRGIAAPGGAAPVRPALPAPIPPARRKKARRG